MTPRNRPLAVVLTITAAAYALAYFRTLRQIVETPDIVAGSRGGIRWPRLGTAVQTVIVHFSLRTLSRSRLHRIILAFYLGVGSAFVIFLVENSEAQNPLADAPAADPWSAVNEPLLAASVAMLGFAMIGARVAFSIPLDLRANWIFRLTGARRVPEWLTGSRYALLLLSAAPVWAASAACCFRPWPWRGAAGHLAVLALLAMILAELCLHGFHKIPFTCSYLPGKSQVHLAIFGGIALFWCIVGSVIYERQALTDPLRFVPLLAGLGCVWLCARWWNAVAAPSADAEVSFEELATPAVQQLGLNRDGGGALEPPAMT